MNDCQTNEDRALYGRSACKVGDPDWDVSDNAETSASDTIANILHFVEESGGDPRLAVQRALDYYLSEAGEIA